MNVTPPGAIQNQSEPTKDDLKRKLKLVRAGQGITESLATGHLDKAFNKAIVAGIKLAEHVDNNPFTNPLVSPLVLAIEMRKLGLEALAWRPETLFAAIDKRFNGWSDEACKNALESFHDTGVIKSAVPMSVRQKIYAIRIIATSDTAHNQWHIFEKVGSAFNDRIAQFGIVEKLSPAECTRTIAIIENIRPDEYAKEVKIYIAASAHEEGLLTLQPSKWLKMADLYLRDMNKGSMAVEITPEAVHKIEARVSEIRSRPEAVQQSEDALTIQAIKLLAIDAAGDRADLGE